MNLATRVKNKRLDLKLTQERLAEMSDMSQTSLQKIESGKSSHSKKLLNIAKALGCTPEYLLYGVTIGTDSNISLTHTSVNYIPMISWVQAGNWSEIEMLPHDDIDYYLCPINCSKRSFALKVQGASMEPRFRQGDQIFIDPEAQVENGSLVIARLVDENQATFKQLIIEGDRKFLKALNHDWPERFLEINGNCTIVGKVIYKGEWC